MSPVVRHRCLPRLHQTESCALDFLAVEERLFQAGILKVHTAVDSAPSILKLQGDCSTVGWEDFRVAHTYQAFL